jgi:hypothetical protein
MAELSPAAQAILNAYGDFEAADTDAMAAALRSAADQVVPEECLAHFPNDSEWQEGFVDANARIRFEVLAIAAELEAVS